MVVSLGVFRKIIFQSISLYLFVLMRHDEAWLNYLRYCFSYGTSLVLNKRIVPWDG